MLHVIAYDVEDSGNRERLSTILLDYGDRVQMSVFEASLSTVELATLLKRVSRLIDLQDSLRIYPVCSSCEAKRVLLGRPDPPRQDDGHAIIV